MRQDDFDSWVSLHRSTHVHVSRARLRSSGVAVVVKALPPGQLTHSAIARVRYEYKILETLAAAQTHNVPRPLGLLEEPGVMALVQTDMGGSALRVRMQQGGLELSEVLQVATGVVAALVDMHRAQVVHKDINPNNIVYNPDNRTVELIDFDLASLLARELQNVDNLRGLEGTVPYVSPEQTGRLSRALDYRSDFFSLGVTLYEMLAGRTPFAGDDLPQTVYAILTHAPDALPAHVPVGVAQVVLRLLEKDPERRYKSATGLLHDLQHCQQSWQTHGGVDAFDLGKTDRSERFDIPQGLYGRTAEVQHIIDMYRAVAAGTCGFLLVTGPSGVGKSALVHELHTAILEHNGLFAAGKYENLHRHQPFSALAQAIEALMRRFMMEPEAVLEKWRVRLQGALGNVGQALVDVAPSVENLLGKQKPLTALGPQETENRLLSVMQNLVNALSARQPLVLFLDDLQWADAGTLKWLVRMTSEPHRGAGVLVVGAYRDGEVNAQHPLRGVVHTLQTGRFPVDTLQVQPLDLAATSALVRDATQAPEDQAQALAQLLLAKTAGVPFFVREFLQSLATRQLLRWDAPAQAWTWDAAALQAATVTDNVAQLMTATLSTLSPAAQRMVSLAACVGNEFSHGVLKAVSGQSNAEVAACLAAPLAQGLIVPVGSGYRYATDDQEEDALYRFAHDQIVQAAYDLMSADAAMDCHYALGRYLMQDASQAGKVGRVVEHLNRALPLFQNDTERLAVAKLNWQAAIGARLSAASELARTYLQVALQLLPADAWHRDAGLCSGVHQELAQTCGLLGDVPAMLQHLAVLDQNAPTSLDKASVALRRMQLLALNHQSEAAQAAGVAGLRLLGFSVSVHPRPWQLVRALVALLVQLRGRSVERLVQRPAGHDAHALVADGVLGMMAEVSILFLNPLLFLLCTLIGARVALRDRLISSRFITGLGSVLAVLSRYDAARAWQRAGALVQAREANNLAYGRALFTDSAYVFHLDTSPTALMKKLSEAVDRLLENGEPLTAAHAGTAEIFVQSCLSVDACLHLIDHPPPLTALSREFNAHVHGALALMCRCVQGHLPTATLNGEFDAYAASVKRADLPPAALRGCFCFANVIASWVHGEYGAAYAAAASAVRDGVFDVLTDHLLMIFVLFAALTCTRVGHKPWWFYRARLKLRQAGAAGPLIYGGMPLLIDAETAAQQGKHTRAQRLYEQAGKLLGQSGYTIYVGPAYECAARHAHARGMEVLAEAYVQHARAAYGAWGAARKVVMLENEFQQYFGASSSTWHSTKTAGAGDGQSFDLPAVVAASQALAGERVQERLVQKILAALQQTAGATRAVLLFRPEDHTLQVAGDTQGQPGGLPTNLLNFVARTQDTLVVNDVSNHPAVTDPYFEQAQPKSFMAAPIMHQGRVHGVIYLENHVNVGAFGTGRLSLVKLLASQAASALENARLYAHLEEVVAHRTEELRHAHARLIALERQSTEIQMAGGFAHEMRNALGGTSLTLRAVYTPNPAERDGFTMCEIWQQGYAAMENLLQSGAPPDDLRTVIQQMRDNHHALEAAMEAVDHGLTRALRITGQILTYAQVGGLVVGDESVAIAPVIDAILQEFKSTLEDHAIVPQVQVRRDARFPMKQEHAYTILRNLVDNALDALRSQDHKAQRELRVTVLESAPHVVLEVADTGCGIPVSAQSHMFEPFYSTKGARGTGLGLGLCRKLIQAYGGDIGFRSNPGKGTTFSLHVPRRS